MRMFGEFGIWHVQSDRVGNIPVRIKKGKMSDNVKSIISKKFSEVV